MEQFLVEQLEHINSLSQAIDATNTPNDLSSLDLYNERGTSYFFIGEFESALQDFDYVVTNLQSRKNYDKNLMVIALWGRLFCHAFRSQLQETYDDSLLIQDFFMEHICCEGKVREEAFETTRNCKNGFSIIPIAKFAHPEEKVTRWECHDRTSTIANKMRSLADHIPVFFVKEIVLFTIDYLSGKAHQCCENGHHWTVCLGPIADAWKKLDDTWDQLVDLFNRGIKIQSFLTGS